MSFQPGSTLGNVVILFGKGVGIVSDYVGSMRNKDYAAAETSAASRLTSSNTVIAPKLVWSRYTP